MDNFVGFRLEAATNGRAILLMVGAAVLGAVVVLAVMCVLSHSNHPLDQSIRLVSYS